MIKINVNQVKRIYANIKDNIVTIIIIFALVLGAASTLLIIKDDGNTNTIEKENVTYSTITNQRFGISNVHTLNPITSKDRDAYYIDKLLFSGLFKQENDLKLSLDLASNYQTNESKGTVLIDLRGDVKFHNGDKLTASDVVYTFEAIMDYGKEGLYYDLAKHIESITAKGNYQVLVKFKSVNDACLDYLTFPIIDSSNQDSAFKPNGTGQYQIGKVNEEKYIKLKPNKNYYGDKASNNLYFQIFKKSTVIENLLTSYEVTAFFNKDTVADKEDVNSDITVQYIDSNNLEYLGFNYKNSYLNKRELRQAIAYSIDLNELVEEAYGNYGKVNDSIYFPNYLGVENKGDVYKCSYNKAIKLINKLNFYDHDKDGYLEDIEGNTINLTILVNKDNANRMLVANYLAECLSELQIKSEIKALSWNSYVSEYNRGYFDLIIGGFSINSHDKLKSLFDEDNKIGFEDENIIEKINKLYQCTSIEVTCSNYINLKNALNKELPYYCICYKQYKLLGCPNMTFEELPNFDNVYKGVNTWVYKKIISD